MRLPSRGHIGTLAIVVAFVITAAVVSAVWRSVGAPSSVTRHLRETESPAGATVTTHRQAESSNGASVTISPGTTGERVRPGFLGFSFEYWAIENYAGQDPRALDPIVVHLIRNVVPDQPASIRIGGVTSDRTWWPVAGVARPPGAHYILSRRRLEVARALAQATDARLIMGVQFEADSPPEAAAQSRAMRTVIGGKRIEGFELGNEPERYAFAWFYKQHGVKVFGRGPGWQFGSFIKDYTRVARAMGRVPLAGPSIGSFAWMSDLPQFLRSERVAIVTLHRYPMQSCAVGPGAPNYPTIAHFLGEAASRGLADQFAPFVAMVHAHGLPVRNAEMNSVSCGDAHGVANTFASALWALDALFGMASIGVDGVNLHTYSGAADQLFSIKKVHSQWQAFVAPEYYGVLMFSQAAPADSRLLHVSGPRGLHALRAWATRARDGRIHVVLINDDIRHPETLSVRVPGAPSSAKLERLEAPHARSFGGVTLGGRSFGPRTTTGLLRGPFHTVALAASGGAYRVRLPAASAAMITLG